MAVNVVKSEQAQLPQALFPVVETGTVTADLVDKFAVKQQDLQKKLAKLKPLQEEVAELQKELIALVDTLVAPNTGLDIEGQQYRIEVTECMKKRVIKDMKKVRQLLGADLFMEIAKVTLADLEKYMTGQEVESVVDVSQTDGRRIKVIKKG